MGPARRCMNREMKRKKNEGKTFPGVAIVGMACRYPEARTTEELWENVLAQRRAFRRMPRERLRREDYYSPNVEAADRTYTMEAALIEGYEFDRLRFRVVGSTYRSADMAHWLALDIAARALEHAGFRDADGLPRQTTGVLLGNTLTGEFSRASGLRLRWPYVRRVVDAALKTEGWTPERRRGFLGGLESMYKSPFPPIGEESLAGGLSNTIAGRICNHFDLKGGGFTLDGACSSSLLAVTSACSYLRDGDLDVALAGGVDLSLDPFEIVGFAKTGALAPEEMRLYDARSEGFWPGEGCGFVVLMRYEDALAQKRKIYAVIRGWGISSDGTGGLTRPEVEGQLLAVRRAYHRAGFPVHTVGYFEGHGTGTSIGDAVELRVLSTVRKESGENAPPAVVGSIKANFGHTKAAAGVAGLIKAALALHNEILPPTTGCEEPHPELADPDAALRIMREGKPWPKELPLRAGVSSMGFGGINVHIALEGRMRGRRRGVTPGERRLLASAQDAEVFFLSAENSPGLLSKIEALAAIAPDLARSELADLAAHLARTHKPGVARAALVAGTPTELDRGLDTLLSWIREGEIRRLDPLQGVFLGTGKKAPRIGFLFPGQGAPSYPDGGALRRRFREAQSVYEKVELPEGCEDSWTALAQPAIVTASIATMKVLSRAGIKASVALGHSLGELTALHWGGALSETAVLRLAEARGKIMGEIQGSHGAMASVAASPEDVAGILRNEPVVIAGFNGPLLTAVSGDVEAVDRVVERAHRRGWEASRLRVSHAFHSSFVAPSAERLARYLRETDFAPPRRSAVSTVTGRLLTADEDPRQILYRQVTEPVLFHQAVSLALSKGVDLFIEVGPGHILSTLVKRFDSTPVISTDAAGPSLRGLLTALAAAHALGTPVRPNTLFKDRFTRPFDPEKKPKFLVNPCERAPLPEDSSGFSEAVLEAPAHMNETPAIVQGTDAAAPEDTLELVRALIADKVELPLEAVRPGHRLLDDLHLNSIIVSQLVAEAARRMGMNPPAAPTEFANATVSDFAKALKNLAEDSPRLPGKKELPAGVDVWIRPFRLEWVDRPLSGIAPVPSDQRGEGRWTVLGVPGDSLADALRERLEEKPRAGVLVCLPGEDEEAVIPLLLKGAREVLRSDGVRRFVLVQRNLPAGGFARTLYQEVPGIASCVVTLPPDHPRSADWVVAELERSKGYSEAAYDEEGRRREPVLQLWRGEASGGTSNLGASDVLLVTGGGKGIAAECALALAKTSGVRLGLVGRSDPSSDEKLASNLVRMRAEGAHVHYEVADVTDEGAVGSAVQKIEKALGPVTAVLHAAGINEPQSLRTLDEEAFRRTVAAKVDGFRNVIGALNPSRLRLLVTFGSIIARIGLHGEADYAVGNEWLTHLTERFQKDHPRCRCLALEWSVWSGAGMGERLGRIEALERLGIMPITIEDGVRWFLKMVTEDAWRGAVILTGRFGDSPTLRLEGPELPLWRFLERPRVYVPGVELVVEADLSIGTDPYLADHQIQETPILPAVMGLEAMAQSAAALAGTDRVFSFEKVEFLRPIVIPRDGLLTIQIAALTREKDGADVVLRSGETSFQTDHFRAVCRFHAPPAPERSIRLEESPGTGEVVPLEPRRDLYGGLLFQGERFRRLQYYTKLTATECEAELAAEHSLGWFSPFQPSHQVLGDPGLRDAAVHALQACVPHATVLPVGIDRLTMYTGLNGTHCRVRAKERLRDGNLFVYDLEIRDQDGEPLEAWEGLRLRIAGPAERNGRWVLPLLATYLERRLQEHLPERGLRLALLRTDVAIRRSRSDRAIQDAVGRRVDIRERPDGKPEVGLGISVSASHAGDMTLAVAGPGPVGCDMEPVISRPENVWEDILGSPRFRLSEFVAAETEEPLDVAATRIWAAAECLKKAGAPVTTPLTFAASHADRWVLLEAGHRAVATYVGDIRDVEEQMIFAFLSGGDAHEDV
jgi:enediyne polyketide synthase